MKLHVLGTGSKGNCYLLENSSEALVIETGIPFKEVKKALGFDTRKIVGVIQTHSHKDHSRYENEYLAAGIPVCRPYLNEQTMLRKARFGRFDIFSFECVHDVPCVGYVIVHPDLGKMVYATDTEYVKYVFGDPAVMLIEANYDRNIIPDGAPNREHVMTGHMEIETTLGCIKANLNPNLRSVILCHLSDGNSDERAFLERTRAVVCGGCQVHVASKGMVVDLREIPF